MARLQRPDALVASTATDDSTGEADFIDRLTRHVADVPTHSWQAYAMAFVAVVLATAVRASFGTLGSHFPLTFYFPAILAIGVMAGTAASVAAALASISIVWFAFLPPYLQLGWPKAEDFTVWFLFVLASSVTILVAWVCRTALLRAHAHQLAYRTVARELRHRDKNSLAVAEAIIRKSLQHDPSAAEAIVGRLRAVDHASGLLASSTLQAVDLRSLIETELAPYGEGRFVVGGARCEIPASKVRHVLFIVHELATNAAKYGALSTPTGRVLVDWQAQGNGISLRWREEGGPRVVPSERKGFGSTLIMQSVKALSGEWDRRFEPEGLCCSLRFVNEKRSAA